MISPFSVTNIYFGKSGLCYNTDDRICGGCYNIACSLFLQNNIFSLPCKSQAIHTGIRSAGSGSPFSLCIFATFGSAGSVKCLSMCQLHTMVLSSALTLGWEHHPDINQTCFIHRVTVLRST